MELFLRRALQIAVLLLATVVTAGAAPMPAFDLAVMAAPADVQPADVVSGYYEKQFAPIAGDDFLLTDAKPRWVRIIANRDYPAAELPQLLLSQPYRKEVEAWRPGDSAPIRRSTYGPNADLNHSTLYHVIPLTNGLRKGEAIYLRVVVVDSRPSQVAIEPLGAVSRMDMAYSRARTLVLSSLSFVALLAMGYAISLRQRGYAFLALTLVAQVITLAIEGGEVRSIEWLLSVAQDRRTNILLNTAAVLASVRFLMFFLNLPAMQPRVARLLDVCCVILFGIIALSTVQVWYVTALIGNLVLLVVIGAILKAIVSAMRQRLREAFFLLIAWAPLMMVLVVKVGGLQRWWPSFDWLEFAYPFAMTFGGIGLFFGLTDKLHQLRRDHDTARHRASHDGLTGVMSRTALDEALRNAVEEAHRTGRPLSVVFFDVDRFKTINDEHGHATGDEVLRIVALRTRNRLRAMDLCGRYGGDEMLIGLIDAPIDEALKLAEHLRAAVSDGPVAIDGKRLHIGLSLGVAQLRNGETLEQLLKRADAALYASKANGRGRVTGHSPALDAPIAPA
ncbi:GGDEF domain-containing protein [Lysobacter gummosus]|uniref:GGDEF domain-containing protein n=2 Tax=Lysobacter gummosus TaxID=262324 RepID=UPI003630BF79